MPLNVELVSPERLLFKGDASLVVARTTDGEIGFEPGHIPFVGACLLYTSDAADDSIRV